MTMFIIVKDIKMVGPLVPPKDNNIFGFEPYKNNLNFTTIKLTFRDWMIAYMFWLLSLNKNSQNIKLLNSRNFLLRKKLFSQHSMWVRWDWKSSLACSSSTQPYQKGMCYCSTSFHPRGSNLKVNLMLNILPWKVWR